MKREFNLFRSIPDGMSLGCDNYLQIITVILLYFLIQVGLSLSVIGIIFLPGVILSYYKALITISRGGEVSFKEHLREGFVDGMWWKSWGLMISLLVGVVLGLMLIVVPGLYLLVMWMFAYYLLIDKKLGVFDCLSTSRRLVQKIGSWRMFGFAITFVLIASALSVPVYTAAFIFIGNTFVANMSVLFVQPLFIMIPIELYNRAIVAFDITQLEEGSNKEASGDREEDPVTVHSK